MRWSSQFEAHVAHANEEAFLDSLYGLVPCDVLAVTDRTIKIRVRWGECHHPLQLGESPFGEGVTIEEYPHRDVVPRSALRRQKGEFATYIQPYRWEETP